VKFQRAAIERERKEKPKLLEAAKDASLDVSDELAADAARRAAADRLRRGRDASKSKPDKQSLDDLIADAIKSGKLPTEAALLASTQPPIIITQQTVDVKMDVTVNAPITGVPGEHGEEFGRRVNLIVGDRLQSEFRAAIDQLRPRLAR
jgi:hypothetical protein